MTARSLAPHSVRRRPAWVLACLWLLVALMPLRAWAAADMMAAHATDLPAPVAAAVPPCHAAAADTGDDPQAHGGACELCLFCAPVFAGSDALPKAPTPQGGALEPSVGGAAPEGALDPLFRPPRG
ncbi:MAG: hypothetical protein ACK5Y7_11380 [Betaproteobacteria bacterium]|nr:hypothetical protein [Rubrivivax sp.]MCZ8175150.1 hypothetical protein [Burkholderiaceae bacterium]